MSEGGEMVILSVRCGRDNDVSDVSAIFSTLGLDQRQVQTPNANSTASHDMRSQGEKQLASGIHN